MSVNIIITKLTTAAIVYMYHITHMKRISTLVSLATNSVVVQNSSCFVKLTRKKKCILRLKHSSPLPFKHNNCINYGGSRGLLSSFVSFSSRSSRGEKTLSEGKSSNRPVVASNNNNKISHSQFQ